MVSKQYFQKFIQDKIRMHEAILMTLKEELRDARIGKYQSKYQNNKPVKERTPKEHLSLIKNKFNGSVRNYLLSMGPFKEDSNQDKTGGKDG